MNYLNSRYFVVLLLFLNISLTAQERKELFTSEVPLRFTLLFENKEVLRDKIERDEHEAVLIEKLIDSTNFTHNIKISVRGKSRTKICKFPPLKLNFKKKATKNTVFSGQDKLKLVTHCGSSNENEAYILKEYLVYKLYNVITPLSINARLCEITYVDASDKKKTIIKKGILLEDVEDVGKRNGLLEFKKDLRNQESLDKTNLDNLVFFQYLIGNLDWSIAKRHNIKILKDDSTGLPVGVPYDFDFSGLVDTYYAKPPEIFNITSVRQRIFRGFCRNNNYEHSLKFYNSKKEQLYSIINNSPHLKSKDRETAVKYFDEFYEILNNRNLFYQNVIKACNSEHQHVYIEWND